MALHVVYFDRFGDKKQRQYFADSDAGRPSEDSSSVFPYWSNTIRYAKFFMTRDDAQNAIENARKTTYVFEEAMRVNGGKAIICIGEINVLEVGSITMSLETETQ